MKIYMVGGCVRDKLLGLEPKDIDYVVVGSTPEEMLALGYEKVGASFPVFLHPVNRREYALARTERKVGAGYHGFEVVCSPNITLEDDLRRRDLTINSMAIDPYSDELIDPYGGQHDLAQGILRHTSEAFAEDPIRVLRTARFAARYGFKVATDTIELMHRVVDELVTVPKERIWLEFEKGLMESRPWLMMGVLDQCEALSIETMRPYSKPNWSALERICESDPLYVRFAMISAGFMPDDYHEHRVPHDVAYISKNFHHCFEEILFYRALSKEDRVTFLTRFRAYNDRSLLDKCLECYVRWNAIHPEVADVVDTINRDLAATSLVDAALIAVVCKDGLEIKNRIFEARVNMLQK